MRYGSKAIGAVSIETLAPLQDSVPAERARSTVEFFRQKTSVLALLSPKVWRHNGPDLIHG